MNEKPLLILVDGSSYLYRAFHALPNLSTSSGQPTGAIYGVINMIRKLLTDYAPQFAAVVFDAKGKTFRHELYSEYKANRPPMPEELRSQIPYVNDLVNALGIPLLCIEGVEADDVIATLARQATRAGLQTLVSTGDKDMAQIVNDQVNLVDSMQDRHLDVAGVEQKFGVVPEDITDYLALIGDTSDNIPGVPKVGPKTATKWLKTYGSLEEVVQHADEVKGKVGDNLRSSVKQLPLSKQLVTVKTDVETQVDPTDLIVKKADADVLKKLYSELEFNSWLTDIVDVNQDQSEIKSSSHYITIYKSEELDDWLGQLRSSELFAFDTETTSLEPVGAKIVGVSFALTPGQAAYVPCGHDYTGAPAQLAVDTVLKKLKPILEDETRYKVGQNLKYDHCVLAGYGIELNGIKFDTMLESYVLDSVATRHDMDTLALKYLGHKTTTFEDVAGKGKNQLGFNEVAVEEAGPYAAEDADVALRLHQTLWPKLKEENRLRELFELVEMPLVPASKAK